MRILILSQWFPPEPMKFLLEMAEMLAALGHDVRVLTGFPNWPTGRLYPGYRMRLRCSELIGGIHVTRAPLFPDHGRSAAKRAANLGSFVATSALIGSMGRWRPDIIHTVQPPTTCAAGWALSRRWGAAFTYEVQDMWPETLKATGLLTNDMLGRVIGRYCNWTYRSAVGIRVISDGFRDNLVQKGVDPRKIAVIPNWVDTSFFRPLPRDPALEQRFGLGGSFNVLYAGTIGLAQGLGTLIDSAALLEDLPDIRIVLAGDGLELPALQARVRQLRLGNVLFLGRLPEDQMPALLALADATVLHLKRDPLFAMTIPHKLCTYMAAGKPVIAAVEGDAAAVVQTGNAGIVCRPEDPASIANALRQLRTLGPDGVAALGRDARRAACELFSKDKVTSDLAAFLERCRNQQTNRRN